MCHNTALSKWMKVFPGENTRLDRALAAIRAGRVDVDGNEVRIIANSTVEDGRPKTWKVVDGKCICPDARKSKGENPSGVCYHMVAAEIALDGRRLTPNRIVLKWEENAEVKTKDLGEDAPATWTMARAREAAGIAFNAKIEIARGVFQPRNRMAPVNSIVVHWIENDAEKTAEVPDREAAGAFMSQLRALGVPWRSITATVNR